MVNAKELREAAELILEWDGYIYPVDKPLESAAKKVAEYILSTVREGDDMIEEVVPLKLCVDLLMANSTFSVGMAHAGLPHISVRLPQHMAQAKNYQDLQVMIERAVREMAKKKGGVNDA